MGTHPIFESDFDCLTVMVAENETEINDQAENGKISVDQLWTNILSNNAKNQLTLANKRTIILGDNLTGRRTLISKIINDDKDPYRGHGLSYEYINITGKDEEECGCLSFITVDPSAPIRAQFTAAIPDAESLSDSLIVITLDFSKPWAVLESLQRWVREIKSHRDEWLRIPAKDINEMKDNLQEKWLKQSNLEELEGCILENSLGCEILVVGLKADILQTTLNEEGMSEQHADLLQFQLREECLKLGAALFYCSAKEPRTVETLKAYILNNLFGIESDQLQPRGVSREAIFIPMGWDTEKRINLLKEGPELPATIATPRQRPTLHEQELTAEDEQQSLLRVEQLLEQASQSSAARGGAPSPSVVKSGTPARPAGVPSAQLPRPSVPTASATKISAASPSAAAAAAASGAAPQANERMLADFFNQLLLKNGPTGRTPKPTAPGGAPSAPASNTPSTGPQK